MKVNPIPDGYQTVTPYLSVKGATQVIAFLKKAFGAEEISVSKGLNGEILNAEIRLGTSMVMVSDSRDHTPRPGQLYLYVPDTDAAYRSAVAAGGKSLMEPADQFYGDRNAGVEDTAGNQWWIATRVENVSGEEVSRRYAALSQR